MSELENAFQHNQNITDSEFTTNIYLNGNSTKPDVIGDIRTLFLEKYLEKNKIGRKSKYSYSNRPNTAASTAPYNSMNSSFSSSMSKSYGSKSLSKSCTDSETDFLYYRRSLRRANNNSESGGNRQRRHIHNQMTRPPASNSFSEYYTQNDDFELLGSSVDNKIAFSFPADHSRTDHNTDVSYEWRRKSMMGDDDLKIFNFELDNRIGKLYQ